MWIASRTTSLPRNENERFETPPLIFDARAALLDQPGRLDEVQRIARVLLDAGRDREDVRVEDDRLRIEADLVDEQPIGALADRDLALGGVGLADLVERHHHHGRAVALHGARLGEEVRLALLEADRVGDAAPLHALEAGLDHAPLRAVDHDRDARDLGLGRDQVQEPGHHLLGVEHALVHVDVEDVGAAAHLIERDLDRARCSRRP